MLTVRITCLVSLKRYLPYKTLYSVSSYSAVYNPYNFYDRSKLFAVLDLPVNYPLELWYFDLKYALKCIK